MPRSSGRRFAIPRSARLTPWASAAPSSPQPQLAHYLALRRVDLRELQEREIWVIGTAGEAESDLYAADWPVATAWVLGAEGEGMRRLTRETCDLLVKIPMHGSVESLNVSVAAGVCLYEARRRRP